MHRANPSIIAKDGNEVVGYALVSLREVAIQHPLLEDLIFTIERLSFDKKPLKESRYVVVGQLCVGKNYRGMGLVQKMYNEFRKQLQDQFDYCITDVASSNPRSLKAHLKAGFQVIDTLNYGGITWNLVLWDWR